MEHGKRLRLECDDVFSLACTGGDIDLSKRLVEPPRVLVRGERLAVTRNGIQVRPFHDDEERFGRGPFDRESITDLEATFGRERLGDQFLLVLHGTVPRIARQAVLLPGQLIRTVVVDILLCFTAGRDIHIVDRQDVGTNRVNLDGPAGCDDTGYVGALLRTPSGPFPKNSNRLPQGGRS